MTRYRQLQASAARGSGTEYAADAFRRNIAVASRLRNALQGKDVGLGR